MICIRLVVGMLCYQKSIKAPRLEWKKMETTTLQSVLNAKLNLQFFWPCHEKGMVEMFQEIPLTLDLSVYKLKVKESRVGCFWTWLY